MCEDWKFTCGKAILIIGCSNEGRLNAAKVNKVPLPYELIFSHDLIALVVNFINIFCPHFLYESSFKAKLQAEKKLLYKTFVCKTLMKLTLSLSSSFLPCYANLWNKPALWSKIWLWCFLFLLILNTVKPELTTTSEQRPL